MRIGIIVGSHRPESNSKRAGSLVEQRLTTLGHEAELVSLAGNPLPLWDESAWDATSSLSAAWKPYGARLTACQGFVVISPEWSGMVPAGLKNFFLFCSTRDVGHKPALIVGVSSTRGGAYPVAELRISSYKNTRLCYIPEHVIIRDADHILGTGPESQSEDAKYIRRRLDAAVALLASYAEALRNLRHLDVFSLKDFPFGM